MTKLNPELIEQLYSGPKIRRTHCYAQKPHVYDIHCPVCGGINITWSEFEKHIWCFDCKRDIFLPIVYAGIFSGPIPTRAAEMMGISFDRINIKTGEVLKFNPDDATEFNKTWRYSKKLSEYAATIDVKISLHDPD